jgi:hypothetical protein
MVRKCKSARAGTFILDDIFGSYSFFITGLGMYFWESRVCVAGIGISFWETSLCLLVLFFGCHTTYAFWFDA